MTLPDLGNGKWPIPSLDLKPNGGISSRYRSLTHESTFVNAEESEIIRNPLVFPRKSSEPSSISSLVSPRKISEPSSVSRSKRKRGLRIPSFITKRISKIIAASNTKMPEQESAVKAEPKIEQIDEVLEELEPLIREHLEAARDGATLFREDFKCTRQTTEYLNKILEPYWKDIFPFINTNKMGKIKEILKIFYSCDLPQECRAILAQERILVEKSKHSEFVVDILNNTLFLRVICPYLCFLPEEYEEKGKQIALIFGKLVSRQQFPQGSEYAPILNPLLDRYYDTHVDFLLKQSEH